MKETAKEIIRLMEETDLTRGKIYKFTTYVVFDDRIQYSNPSFQEVVPTSPGGVTEVGGVKAYI